MGPQVGELVPRRARSSCLDDLCAVSPFCAQDPAPPPVVPGGAWHRRPPTPYARTRGALRGNARTLRERATAQPLHSPCAERQSRPTGVLDLDWLTTMPECTQPSACQRACAARCAAALIRPGPETHLGSPTQPA